MILKPHHGQEDTKLWIHVHSVAICEDEDLLTFFLGCEYACDLLSSHGQHGKVDTVKLVKTSP